MSYQTKLLKLTKEWPQQCRAKNEAMRKREKNSASLWNWFQFSLPSHLSLSSLLTMSQGFHLPTPILPHTHPQVLTHLSLFLLFCKKYLSWNHFPGSGATIAIFKTLSYKFHCQSLHFPIDRQSFSTTSYMDMSLKGWSITQGLWIEQT